MPSSPRRRLPLVLLAGTLATAACSGADTGTPEDSLAAPPMAAPAPDVTTPVDSVSADTTMSDSMPDVPLPPVVPKTPPATPKADPPSPR